MEQSFLLSREINIADRLIGPEHPPFIVAEMSGNHNQSLDRALQIVNAAAQAGADALKIQTYTADTMTLNIDEGEFFINDPKSPWSGKSLYKLYQEAYTPWEWHEKIFEECDNLGIIGFSSPFDASAVDFLESLNVPAYKIASFEIVDIPLIKKVAATGKPVIISTGMATEQDIEDAVVAARSNGCEQLVLLKCTSNYPADPVNSNLKTIPYLRDRFNVQVGLSDHTMGIGVAIASIALGATVIEKHFTLSRAEGGVDASFSLEPAELKALVRESKITHRSLGKVYIGSTDSETASLQYRRSLYVIKDIAKGELFTQDNIRAIRPASGLSPKHYEQIIGKKAQKNIKPGTPLTWEHIAE